MRSIQHSKDGQFIYVNLGDVRCLKLRACDLSVDVDGNTFIVEDE